jgi:hypothetical protein
MNTLRDVAEWAGLPVKMWWEDRVSSRPKGTDIELLKPGFDKYLSEKLLSPIGTVAILEALGKDNPSVIIHYHHDSGVMVYTGQKDFGDAPDLPHAVLAAAIAYRKGVKE